MPLDNLDWKDRLDFFVEGESGFEPWMLWLSEAGLPLPYRTWEAVFSTANARCHGLGVDIRCHPHMLRHSFALRMLVSLIYAHDRRMGITAAERREFRHLFGDPWVLVQTMLGHANRGCPEVRGTSAVAPVRIRRRSPDQCARPSPPGRARHAAPAGAGAR